MFTLGFVARKATIQADVRLNLKRFETIQVIGRGIHALPQPNLIATTGVHQCRLQIKGIVPVEASACASTTSYRKNRGWNRRVRVADLRFVCTNANRSVEHSRVASKINRQRLAEITVAVGVCSICWDRGVTAPIIGGRKPDHMQIIIQCPNDVVSTIGIAKPRVIIAVLLAIRRIVAWDDAVGDRLYVHSFIVLTTRIIVPHDAIANRQCSA